jgi:hypothetical protein
LARRDQLITFDDRGRQGYFGFRHSLSQEVAYSGMPGRRRRAPHQLVGERLEATTDDAQWSAAELAEHFTRSGDGRRAMRYRLAAAEWPPFATPLQRLWSTFAPGSRLTEVGQRALDEARRLASARPSCVTPEIDRLAAALLLQAGGEPAAVERHLRTALAIARDHDALALELRAAADLRRVELANGRTSDAARVLRSVVEKFTEGHRLADLRDAIELLRFRRRLLGAVTQSSVTV